MGSNPIKELWKKNPRKFFEKKILQKCLGGFLKEVLYSDPTYPLVEWLSWSNPLKELLKKNPRKFFEKNLLQRCLGGFLKDTESTPTHTHVCFSRSPSIMKNDVTTLSAGVDRMTSRFTTALTLDIILKHTDVHPIGALRGIRGLLLLISGFLIGWETLLYRILCVPNLVIKDDLKVLSRWCCSRGRRLSLAPDGHVTTRVGPLCLKSNTACPFRHFCPVRGKSVCVSATASKQYSRDVMLGLPPSTWSGTIEGVAFAKTMVHQILRPKLSLYARNKCVSDQRNLFPIPPSVVGESFTFNGRSVFIDSVTLNAKGNVSKMVWRVNNTHNTYEVPVRGWGAFWQVGIDLRLRRALHPRGYMYYGPLVIPNHCFVPIKTYCL